MDETCRLRRGEGYGAYADEGASIAFVWSAATPLPAFRTVFGQKPKPTLSTIGEHMKKDIKFSTRMASADCKKNPGIGTEGGHVHE